jgi:hypothetical membrane protein
MDTETVFAISRATLYICGAILIAISFYIKNTGLDLTPYFYKYILITGIWSITVGLYPQYYILLAFISTGIYCLYECYNNVRNYRPSSPNKKYD